MATLVPCPGCARHVRESETTCPFCDATIGVVAERVVVPMPGDRLLTRAAITFAAAAATTLTACGKEPTDKPVPAPTNTTDNLPAPAYGPPPMMIDAAPPEPAPTTTAPAPTTAPAEAGAPTPSPKTSSSAASSSKPSPSPSTPPRATAHPLYGVPPIRGQ